MLQPFFILLYISLCLCDSSCQYFVDSKYAKLSASDQPAKTHIFFSDTHGSFAHIRKEKNYNQELETGILYDPASEDTTANNKLLDRLISYTKLLHQQQNTHSELPHLANTVAFATFYSDGANAITTENTITILHTANIAILRFDGAQVEHLELQAKELSPSSPVRHLQTDLKDGQYLVIIQYIGTNGIHFPFAPPPSTAVISAQVTASEDDKSVKQALTEPNFATRIIEWTTFRAKHEQYLKTLGLNLIYRLFEGNSSNKRLKEMAVMVIARVPYSPISTFPFSMLFVVMILFFIMIVAFAFSNKSIN